jgi:hypothetical protein
MKVNHNEIFKYYQLGVYPSYEKVYVFGDIHGDLNAFITVLRNANLINKDLHWCGGTAHVVQVGDILDRKIRDVEYSDEDSEFKIISLILTLQLESYIDGGGFHPIIGNHEIMNILGIFDYVSPMGLKHFNGKEGRKKYFEIGGDFCKYLACAWNPVIKIGDFLFCHGGISLYIANKYSINQINYIMRDTLYGNSKNIDQSFFNELFLNEDSILWNRRFSCPNLLNKNLNNKFLIKKILDKYDVSYLIVGHTPQIEGIKLNYNQVICVDTGMSKAFGKNNMSRIHYLEIINNNINIY